MFNHFETNLKNNIIIGPLVVLLVLTDQYAYLQLLCTQYRETQQADSLFGRRNGQKQSKSYARNAPSFCVRSLIYWRQ